MYPQISHITYHYLINGWNQLDGHFLYDVNHNPNKVLREKIYHKYVDEMDHRLEKEGRSDIVELANAQKDLKSKANFYFKVVYDNSFIKVLKRPYFGVWGIFTTPIDFFGYTDHHKARVKIDCDSIDPSLIIIRFGRDVYPYNSHIWNKICKPYEEPGYFLKVKDQAGWREFPTVIIFVPKIKFSKYAFEEAIK